MDRVPARPKLRDLSMAAGRALDLRRVYFTAPISLGPAGSGLELRTYRRFRAPGSRQARQAAALTGTERGSSRKRMKSAQLLIGVLFDSGSLFDGSKKRRFSKTESVKKWAAISLKTHGGSLVFVFV